jgi:hypothetical protein
VFARFLNRVEAAADVSGSRPTVLAYGSAKFAPGGKGEPAVPTSRAFKECASRFDCRVVSEFRTTRTYHENGTLLEKVPTTGTFAACRRIFRNGATSVVDESHTTVVDWATGGRKELVYKVPALLASGKLWERQQRRWWGPGSHRYHRRKARRPWRGTRRSDVCDSYPKRACTWTGTKSSALAIGRLRCMELLGRARPAPFCRSA